MLSKFYIPAIGDFVFISVHGPVCGDAHKNFHSPSREYDLELTIPLTGMQSKYCIPASGDNFAEMQIKIYIPPSREYDPESTVPLAGMQSKFYIPANGDFVIISVHRPHERRCTWKFTFPPRGNTIQNRQFRLRECNQNFTSPQAENL